MKARFVLLLLLLSFGTARLGSQDAPSDAKKQLEAAWNAHPDLCLTALRLLVSDSGAEARSNALDALKGAGFPAGALLNVAFMNSRFVDWLATATQSDPHDTLGNTKKDAQTLVDSIYGQGDGITKLAAVTRVRRLILTAQI